MSLGETLCRNIKTQSLREAKPVSQPATPPAERQEGEPLKATPTSAERPAWRLRCASMRGNGRGSKRLRVRARGHGQ